MTLLHRLLLAHCEFEFDTPDLKGVVCCKQKAIRAKIVTSNGTRRKIAKEIYI